MPHRGISTMWSEVQQDLKQERDKALDEVAALKATVEKFTRAGAEATAREVEAGRRDRALQAQIAKAAGAYQDLKRERDKVLDDVTALKTTVEELTQARADAKAKQADAQQALTRDRNKALDEVAALKTTVEELTQARAGAEARAVELSQRLRNVRQSKAQEIARSIGAALSPFVVAAAVATLGFWTYQLIWSAPQPLLAVTSESAPEAEQQRLVAIKEEEQRQAKTADLEAKLNAAEAEQQRLKEEVRRQTKAAADAETKLKAAEAEQQRQAKAAADADGKRQTAEVEQQRLRGEVQRLKKSSSSVTQPAAQSARTTGLFTIRTNTEGSGILVGTRLPSVSSTAACEERCAGLASCQAFAYHKSSGNCYAYSSAADFKPNEQFDSGSRK